ncbi:MAG TPA: metallophosphoesterase family protein [Ktedonobacterales bacterium]|nr:metallophosphoesterase family protein [Ktedonobacterales bacterium]
MRIALLADIHGNLVALDAALADLAGRGVDQIICLGDLAMSGPQPHECVTRVAALGCPTVLGNCDEFVLRLRQEGRAPDLMRTYARRGAWVAEIDIWSAEALHAEDAAYLAALPLTVSIPLAPDVTLLCAHGSPQSFNHRLLPETPEETVVTLIGPTEATALASGHTHVPMLRRVGPLTIVNPGSVGLPVEVGSDGAITNPADYAEYGIVEWASDGLTWEPRRVALDAEAVRAAARESGMPFADRWRGDWSRP